MNINRLPKESNFQDNGFTIRHIPVISSSHFTEEDLRALRSSRHVESTTEEGGIVVFILSWDTGRLGLSQDADRLLEAVSSQEYSRVEIDGEIGDVYEGFATHDHDL